MTVKKFVSAILFFGGLQVVLLILNAQKYKTVFHQKSDGKAFSTTVDISQRDLGNHVRRDERTNSHSTQKSTIQSQNANARRKYT